MLNSIITRMLNKTNVLVLSLFSTLWILNSCITSDDSKSPSNSSSDEGSSEESSDQVSSSDIVSSSHVSSVDFSSCNCAPEYGVPYSEWSSEESSSSSTPFSSSTESSDESSSSLNINESSSIFNVPLYGIQLSSETSSSSSEPIAEYGMPYSEWEVRPLYGVTPSDSTPEGLK